MRGVHQYLFTGQMTGKHATGEKVSGESGREK